MTSLRDMEMQAPVLSPPTMGQQNLLVAPRAGTPSFLLPIMWTFRHPAPCPASAQRRGQPEGFSIFQVDSLSTVQKEQKQSQCPLKYCSSEIAEWRPVLPQGAPGWSWQPLPPVHWHGSLAGTLPTGLPPHGPAPICIHDPCFHISYCFLCADMRVGPSTGTSCMLILIYVPQRSGKLDTVILYLT